MADARKSNPQHAGLRVAYFCRLWLYCQVSDWLPTVTTCAIDSSINARLVDRMHPVFVLAGSYAIAVMSMDHFSLNTSPIVDAQRPFNAFGLDVAEAKKQARKLEIRTAGVHVWLAVLPVDRESPAWQSSNCFEDGLGATRNQVSAAGTALTTVRTSDGDAGFFP
jgi:hypothetical protein